MSENRKLFSAVKNSRLGYSIKHLKCLDPLSRWNMSRQNPGYESGARTTVHINWVTQNKRPPGISSEANQN